MNIIPPRLVDFSQATLISSPQCPRQLFRLGTDQYLILNKEDSRLMLAIESDEITDAIQTGRGGIVDVELTILRPLICRGERRCGSQEIEVRLYFKRGDVIVIHSHYGIMIL